MILKKELFSVPIYFSSKSAFFNKLRQRRKKAEEKLRNSYPAKQFGIEPELPVEKLEWKFDQIIGWIEFYLNGKTIKANCWFVKAKRISPNLKRKEYECLGKIGDVSQTHRLKNEEIISDIHSFLEKCQNGKYIEKIKKYHIDTSVFLDCLAFLDMKGLIEHINTRKKRV
jgi:hypothetical protein